MLKLKEPMKGFLKDNPQWMKDRKTNQTSVNDILVDVGVCSVLQLIHEANPALALEIVESEEMSLLAAEIVISLFEAERKQRQDSTTDTSENNEGDE